MRHSPHARVPPYLLTSAHGSQSLPSINSHRSEGCTVFTTVRRGRLSRLSRRGIAGALVVATIFATASASAYRTSQLDVGGCPAPPTLGSACAPHGSGTAPALRPAALRARDQIPLTRQAGGAAAARAKQQATADAARAASRRPAPVPATTSYQVSPAVLRLLSDALRLPVSSALLTGLRAAAPGGTLQTQLPAGPALPVTLPNSVKTPAFTGTTLRIDRA